MSLDRKVFARRLVEREELTEEQSAAFDFALCGAAMEHLTDSKAIEFDEHTRALVLWLLGKHITECAETLRVLGRKGP